MTPKRLWLSVFVVWGLLLSGAFMPILGSPGVIQAVRLRTFLESKQAETHQIQADLQALQTQATQLANNKATQEREIRKVLGYAASDELIFDFSKTDSL